MKNSTLNAQNRNADVGVSTLNLHHMEDDMHDINHFADMLDARDGVHPDRGDWNPEPSTDAPDQEYLDIMNEDVFGILIGEGHGVRVHKTDKPWLGRLNIKAHAAIMKLEADDSLDREEYKEALNAVLKEHGIQHWMVDDLTLATDIWEQPFERPQEDLAPLEAGPWTGHYMDEFGAYDDMGGESANIGGAVHHDAGYEVPVFDHDFVAGTWDILADSHKEEQNAVKGLDRAFENAIRVSELSAAKEQREERFVKILTWMSTCDFKEMQKHKGRLWNKVNKSRKQAGKYNRWGWVYLTKQQMDAVNEVINFRVGEYNDSFKRKKSGGEQILDEVRRVAMVRASKPCSSHVEQEMAKTALWETINEGSAPKVDELSEEECKKALFEALRDAHKWDA